MHIGAIPKFRYQQQSTAMHSGTLCYGLYNMVNICFHKHLSNYIINKTYNIFFTIFSIPGIACILLP